MLPDTPRAEAFVTTHHFFNAAPPLEPRRGEWLNPQPELREPFHPGRGGMIKPVSRIDGGRPTHRMEVYKATLPGGVNENSPTFQRWEGRPPKGFESRRDV